MKNLTKKLITLILSVSMFFGTGVTNVFAYTLQKQQAEPTAERTDTNNYDVVGWASHVYYHLSDIKARIDEINTKAGSGASSATIYKSEVNDKANSFNSDKNLLLDFSDSSNAVVNLDNGNKLSFRDNINDPEIVVVSVKDIAYSGQELYAFYEEASNKLKDFHDITINEIDEYLKSIETKIEVMDNLKNSEDNISTSIDNINAKTLSEYEYVLNHIDLTKIIYNEENLTIDLTNALDPVDENGLNIDWNIHATKKQVFEEIILDLVKIKKNIDIFEKNKVLYDSNSYPLAIKFDFETLNTNYESKIEELDKTIPVTNMITFRDSLKLKLIDALNNKIKLEYNKVNLKYTNDVDREITYNALTEILETNGLLNLKYLFIISRINDEDIKGFIDTFDSEYEKSKLSVDNTLASLKINGIKLDVSKEYQELYLPSEVTTLDIEAILSSTKSTISIVKPTTLSIGENTVKIVVTSESGTKREYTIIVVRKEQEKTVTFMNNTISNSDTDNNTISSIKLDNEKNKYKDNEIVDEKLSGWTVLLIVTGIGLIAFGVYLLFGDKATPLIVKKSIVKPRNVKNTKVVKKGKIINKSSKSKK